MVGGTLSRAKLSSHPIMVVWIDGTKCPMFRARLDRKALQENQLPGMINAMTNSYPGAAEFGR
jgi:hypothetical protein